MPKAIQPSTPAGEHFSFSTDDFAADSYLWIHDNFVWIPFIASNTPGQGALSRLLSAISSRGYGIIVPSPFPEMVKILSHLNFEKRYAFHAPLNEHATTFELPPPAGTRRASPPPNPDGFLSLPKQPWMRTMFGYTLRNGAV